MLLIGFVCGLAAMLPWLFIVRRQGKKHMPPCVNAVRRAARVKEDNWEQTRNFLYYDGTEMPINKEEQYE